ncbi:MAG TPA: hypothetical protein VGQ41_00945 [Pyrinomonadaceae bacterium]|jgi:tetratricopeptide (TPR) repeat protein|nr:hypothetical protein [Pyrinomonadaceae bacterium]
MSHLVRISIAAALLSGINITAEAVGVSGYRESRRNTKVANSQPLINFRHGEQQTQNTESEQVFRSAFNLYREGKYDDALAMCIKASSLNPGDYRPRALAGYVYAAQRKLKSASEAFAEAIGLLRRLDPALAAELDEYRKKYVSGLIADPSVKLDQ